MVIGGYLSLSLSLFQYVVEVFSDIVFVELLNYVMTGTCTFKPANVVGLACAAEHYEVEELRQACHLQLPKCLSVTAVCEVLGQLEKHLAFSVAKTMIVQCLEFVDSHASELLASEQMLSLSENMVHLVLRRDTDVPEIVKVKAAFAWGEINAKPQGTNNAHFCEYSAQWLMGLMSKDWHQLSSFPPESLPGFVGKQV